MPGERWILTVDLGTTGPKVGLVSTQGELLAWEKEPTRLSLLPDGGAEQDPHEWWEAIRRVTHRLLEGIPEARDRIVAIGCTGMWSALVPVDREGAPLTPAILWMDARGAPEVEEMFGGFPSVAGYRLDRLILWIRLTGGIPGHSGKDSFAHLLYLRRRRPEVYRETWKFLEAKDYLNLRLTGCAAASYDFIACFGLTDNRNIYRIDDHPTLLRMTGMDRERLPDLRKAVEVLGPLRPEAARDLDFRLGIPVIMGALDVQARAVGSNAVGDEALRRLFIVSDKALVGPTPAPGRGAAPGKQAASLVRLVHRRRISISVISKGASRSSWSASSCPSFRWVEKRHQPQVGRLRRTCAGPSLMFIATRQA
jgi:xylulokinase